MFTKESLMCQFHALQSYHCSGATLSCGARLRALRQLKSALRQNTQALCDALHADFGKPAFDTCATELLMVQEEIDLAIRELPRWIKPHGVPSGLINFPARAVVRSEPLGVALILSPWNYPVLLALSPLVGALAAGNCCVVKPSAQSANTCRVLCRMLRDCFPPQWVLPIEGGHEVSDTLLTFPFDLIFFTGSAAVGQKVLRAAAEHLTPVILELGGKSPCIVDATANLHQAARRIAWGKFVNAGQTCVAPDYLLVERTVAKPLLDELLRAIKRFYYTKRTLTSDFPSLISMEHLERLRALLNGETILFGGAIDRVSRRLSPTVLYPVSPDSPCLREELFGPLLPVIPYDTLGEAVALIRSLPKPLALYHFSQNRGAIRQVLRTTSAGGGCVNDVVMQVSATHLPFGGVGSSGMGRYHGKASFDAFSNPRGLLLKPADWEIPLRYPPHNALQQLLLRRWLER